MASTSNMTTTVTVSNSATNVQTIYSSIINAGQPKGSLWQVVVSDGGLGGSVRYTVNSEAVDSIANSVIPASGVPTLIKSKLGIASLSFYNESGTNSKTISASVIDRA